MTSINRLFLLFFLGMTTLLSAQTAMETYIKFDASCMKKYTYEKTGDYYGMAFLDFHVKISPYETFVFRVLNQKSSMEKVSSINKDLVSCQDLRLLTKAFIKSVNSGQKIVYLTEANGKGHTIYTVRKVAHYHETPNDLTYEDNRRAFNYEYDKINNGLDLDKSDHRQVNFSDRDKLGCAVTRTFNSFNNAQANYTENITFVEGIGLYKVESDKGSLNLKTIDGKDALVYIQEHCQSLATSEDIKTQKVRSGTNSEKEPSKKEVLNTEDPKSVVFNGFGSSFTARGGNLKTEENVKSNNRVKEAAVPDGYHRVHEGETLYEIAKRYNTREDVLVGLNNLGSKTVIDHGKLLKVVNDGSYQDPNPIYRKDEVSGTKLKIHVVRQGENLWDIAKRYGTTTTNIQQLNNLQDRDKINIRQELLIQKIASAN